MYVILVHFTKFGTEKQLWKRVRRRTGSEDYISIKCIITVCITVVFRLDGDKKLCKLWQSYSLERNRAASLPVTLREIKCKIRAEFIDYSGGILASVQPNKCICK